MVTPTSTGGPATVVCIKNNSTCGVGVCSVGSGGFSGEMLVGYTSDKLRLKDGCAPQWI